MQVRAKWGENRGSNTAAAVMGLGLLFADNSLRHTISFIAEGHGGCHRNLPDPIGLYCG